MRDEIIHYLRRSGWVTQSVEAVLPELPRWERRLRSRGVVAIPQPGVRDYSPAAARAHNEINLLMKQAASVRDADSEHRLRNLTRVRPYKP